MKKQFTYLAGAIVLLTSCGGGSSEADLKAAEKVCECMKEKSTEGTSELDEAFVDVDYSLCALDGILEGADVTSEGYTKALNEKCPDLKETQERYLKNQ